MFNRSPCFRFARTPSGQVLAALEVDGLVASFPVLGLRAPTYELGERSEGALDLALAVLLVEFGLAIDPAPYRPHLPGTAPPQAYGPWGLHEAFAAEFLEGLELPPGQETRLPRPRVRRWCERQLAAMSAPREALG